MEQVQRPFDICGALYADADRSVFDPAIWQVRLLRNDSCIRDRLQDSRGERFSSPSLIGQGEPVGNEYRDPDGFIQPVSFIQRGREGRDADLPVLERFREEPGVVPGVQKIIRRILVEPSPGKTLYAGAQLETARRVRHEEFLELEVGGIALVDLV